MTHRAFAGGATVDPARHGTTSICCGAGGRPRCGWQPGGKDRFRGAVPGNIPP